MMYLKVLLVSLLYFGVSKAVLPDHGRSSGNHGETFVEPRNVTSECLADTSHWMSELRRGVPWALKMLDSATKLPSGVMLSVHNHIGVFDQCLDVSVKDEVAEFQGHYCRALMDVIVPEEVIYTPNMTYAFCVPSSCTPEDLQDLLQSYIGPALGINIAVYRVNPNDCHKKAQPDPLPPDVHAFIALISLLAGIVVISAVVEWRLGDKTPPLVRACSLTSTCRSLFNTRKHPADISCLHGIRVGSMFWIILGHRYIYKQSFPKSNPEVFDTYYAKPLVMTIANAMPAVDTFFYLSGLLMCTSFLREVNRRASFDVIKLYIYRYLRLAIPLAIVIISYITIMPRIGDGPIWNNYFYLESRNCKSNWWIDLIFVNNYIRTVGYGMCMGQTWYTAVDMQLAWLSPLVLLPLYHSPRAGLQLMTLLILISCFIPFAVTYIFRFPMSGLQVTIDIPLEGVPVGDMNLQIYHATQARATPYLCGILFAYYLFKTKGKTIEMRNIFVYAGWTLSTVVALTIIYSLSIAHQPDYVYDLVGSAFYAGFHRLGWSAVLIWIVFACVNKYGGVADKILSWNMLLPLSRLTYSAFLLHFVIIIYDTGKAKTMAHFNDFESVHDFFGDLVMVYFISFLLYVLVEGPLLSLLRIAFSKGVQSRKKTEEKHLIAKKHELKQNDNLKNGNIKN